MTKNTRRFTYLSFFLLFFIIAPILVFYGLGYRYNFAKKIIEKNGAVFVKSYPSKATITIDQKIDKEKTPIQITEIKPGLHQITLSKDGYLPWTKNLAVKAGEATFIEDVALFLEDRTKMDLGVGGTNYLINKNKNKYLYLNNNDLFITNTEQEKTTKIFTFDIKTELIDWSPDDQKILFLQDKQYSILEIGSNKIKKLNLNGQKIIWDNQDANLIWFLQKNNLYRYNLALDNTLLRLENIQDFGLTGDYLVTQKQAGIASQVEQWQKDNLNSVRSLANLNLGTFKVLLADNDYLIFTLGTKLYIQRPNVEVFSVPVALVEIYGKYLLINDGYQTILYDYNEDQKEIIDRSSQIVSELKWHPNGSYFINEVNGETAIFELDSRDYRNNVKLFNNPLKKMYLFNKKGDKLFVLTPDENFSLTIQ